jgi:phenylacetate-CoA ligase
VTLGLLGDLEAIYLRLPIPLQNLACTLVGWHTGRTRYGGEFSRILADAEARTYWSVEETLEFRNRRLAAFVAHAVATVPFYADRVLAAGISPSRVEKIDDLADLPVLTKSEAQEHAARLISRAVPSRGTHLVHTSGTTGGGLRFPVTMRSVQEQWATWWRYRGWHGIRMGTWCALFAGRSVVPARQSEPPFWRLNLAGRQLLFSGYHMSPHNLAAYVNELRRRKPPWLHGYPSLLALLAAHLLETRADLGYEVRWVTIGAESLLPHQSALMERAFGVKPLQHYGLTEGVANISQCELGALHVDEDFAAVEFVRIDDEGSHRIVGTNISNLATPLVRYDSQDFANVAEGKVCLCGRPGRVVEWIDGRIEDYVLLRNGARVGRLDHIFKDLVRIREAQIHQIRPGEMSIRVVSGPEYGVEDEQMLLRETAKRVGDDMKVKIDYVSELPRTGTGKLRFVVSEIPEASIEGAPV